MNLAGPDLTQLSKYADELMKRLKEKPGLVDIDTSISLRKPEVQVIVDRERASDLGIPVGTIADTLRVLVGGMPISKFRDGDEQYDVWLRAEAAERSSTANLYHLKLPRPPPAWSTFRAWRSWSTSVGRPRSSGSPVSESSPSWATPKGSPGRGGRSRRRDPQGNEHAQAVLLHLLRSGEDDGRDRVCTS